MLLAKKKNMTQLYSDGGHAIPVTIVDYSECRVIEGSKKSGKFIGIGTKKHPNKAEIGTYGDKNVPEYKVVAKTEVEALPELNPGDVVSVASISKGKGFSGVVKTWGFAGGRRTHGQSDRERHPGSIGAGTTMGRVIPGLKMAKRKGVERVKVRNIKVISVDTENKLITLSGSVPGTYNSVIEIVKK